VSGKKEFSLMNFFANNDWKVPCRTFSKIDINFYCLILHFLCTLNSFLSSFLFCGTKYIHITHTFSTLSVTTCNLYRRKHSALALMIILPKILLKIYRCIYSLSFLCFMYIIHHSTRENEN
jgi:hypothetical protein